MGGVSLGGAAALYVALRRPDRVAIGVGTAELDFPNIEQWPAPKGLTRADVESAMVGMAQSLASNLKGAYINHPKVLLIIEPKANHSSVFGLTACQRRSNSYSKTPEADKCS